MNQVVLPSLSCQKLSMARSGISSASLEVSRSGSKQYGRISPASGIDGSDNEATDEASPLLILAEEYTKPESIELFSISEKELEWLSPSAITYNIE